MGVCVDWCHHFYALVVSRSCRKHYCNCIKNAVMQVIMRVQEWHCVSENAVCHSNHGNSLAQAFTVISCNV